MVCIGEYTVGMNKTSEAVEEWQSYAFSGLSLSQENAVINAEKFRAMIKKYHKMEEALEENSVSHVCQSGMATNTSCRMCKIQEALNYDPLDTP